ncbi:hypothetical protein HERIO_348 [Hepatospora eriocheir]|uniref:RL22 n=1 Tax=Hepatospora eriocheir TaxID=1081669 RepID=A0A1X0QDT0_9MICR|nr:hypothetical protein HERIO_348 [Hepatospora eriocheir]
MSNSEVLNQNDERTFTVNFKNQVEDGLITSQSLIDFLKDKVKIRNRKEVAMNEIAYVDNETGINIVTKRENLHKQNLKKYLQRFLKTKGYGQFCRVSGDGSDLIEFQYRNVQQEETNEQ